MTSSQEAVGPNAGSVGMAFEVHVQRNANTRQLNFGRVYNGAGHGPTASNGGTVGTGRTTGRDTERRNTANTDATSAERQRGGGQEADDRRRTEGVHEGGSVTFF
ncbi:hypothetical protein FA13DRAFT_1712754 [Coprinellus micaceus]|uniref:Uncharacterized protein n=1 Tax=Coprinellus micaceus TaxID=71717 RepID=A0A4Y7SZ91_COPMI|nr:hypothetical protein FA13DRAFT_1712754 [Coprinellus micaceus]